MSKPTNRKNHRNLSDIVSRLPFTRQLNDSQSMLIAVLPLWHDWAKISVSQKLISEHCYLQSELISLQNGKLTLACDNAINASQIKNQQHSLLAYLEKNGIKSVNKVVVRLKLYSEIDDSLNAAKSKPAITIEPIKRTTVSENSLKAIESCRTVVKDETLATALKKLANTLKNVN